MKTVISIKKHRSSVARAIHKQKGKILHAVNTVEHQMTPTWGPLRFIYELGLAIEKHFRNKK